MGLRDLFRGKSETDEQEQQTALTEEEQQAQRATENNERVRPAALPQSAPVPMDSPIASTTTAKQNLARVAQQYNDVRETLQDLLFAQQKEVKDKWDALNQQIQAAQQEADAKGAELTKIQDKLEAATEQASAELVAQQDALNQKIEAEQTQVASVLGNVNELSHELEVLNQRQQKLTDDSNDISTKFENEKDPAAIVALADQYRGKIDANKAEQVQNAQVISEVEEKRQTLKDQLQAVRDELMGNQKSLSDVNDQLEKAQTTIAEEDQESVDQLNKLTDDMDASQAKLHDLQVQADEQFNELTAIKQDVKDWLGVPVPVKGLMMDTDTEVILDMDGLSDDQFNLMKQVVKLLLSRGVTRIGLYTRQFTLNLTDQIAKWTTELAVEGGVVTVHNPLYNLQHQGELGAKFQLPDDVVSDEWNESHTERTLVLPDQDWKLVVRYYDLGDRISSIDYYKNDQISESSTLTTEGQLTANRFYNDDGTKDRDEYYRQNGLGVLTVHYEQDVLKQIELLSPVGMQLATFDSYKTFTEWWLKNEFHSDGVLVGPIENDDYRDFVSTTQGTPMALVTADAVAEEKFTDWANELTHQQYLVANYETEIKLIDRVQQPLNVSLLDPHNLPVTLGVVD